MSELKTLKDLPLFFPENNGRSMGKSLPTLVSSIVLRQEAIKWVKSKRKTMKMFRATDGEDFMAFFNITEEDLK